MLVNASHPLPLEWEPDDLVDLWQVQPRHYHLYPRSTRLSACAAEAANELFALAEKQGFDDFMVLSAYRDSDFVDVIALHDEQAGDELCEIGRQALVWRERLDDAVLEAVECPRVVPGPVPRRFEVRELAGAEQLRKKWIRAICRERVIKRKSEGAVVVENGRWTPNGSSRPRGPLRRNPYPTRCRRSSRLPNAPWNRGHDTRTGRQTTGHSL